MIAINARGKGTISEVNGLVLARREIGRWTVPTIQFDSPADTPLCRLRIGTIINSVTNGSVGRRKQQSWKVQVASEAKAKRGEKMWNPSDSYVISLALCFCPENHGGRSRGLDADNFIKSILDAIAAGLFCSQEMGQSVPYCEC